METTTKRGHAAALAFHATATAVLTQLGRRSSVNEIGRLLGLSQGGYSRALSGAASMVTVDRWLERWAAAGLPRLQLVTDGRDVAVTVAPDVQLPA